MSSEAMVKTQLQHSLSNCESTQTCTADEPGTGIDRHCLNFQSTECLYKTDRVEVLRVPLCSNWTEVGQSLPTLFAEETPYVAAKKFLVPNDAKVCLREYRLLKACNNPYIVTAFGMQSSTLHNTLYIMEAGELSLYKLLHGVEEKKLFPTDVDGGGKDDHYSMAHCLRWMIQLSDALNHLHKLKLLHRDVKSHNILLFNGSLDCKLCDFGCSRYLPDCSDECLTPGVGTRLWRAPEVSDNNSYNETSDCFSLGVVMYEAVFRLPPKELLNLLPRVTPSESCIVQKNTSEVGDLKTIDFVLHSPFKYEVHKPVLDSISSISNGLLNTEATERTSSERLNAQLSVLQQQKWWKEPKPRSGHAITSAVSQQVSDVTNVSNSGIVSSVSLKSRSVFYEFGFDSSKNSTVTEVEKLREHVEKVLDAIGDRTNRRANRGNPFRAKHAFKVLNVGPSSRGNRVAMYIEHEIGDEDSAMAEKLRDYCQGTKEHTDWLNEQFKEDNNDLLSTALSVTVCKVDESVTEDGPLSLE